NVALAMVLCLSVFLWARRLWGGPAAWLALVLCVLSPEILAHGHLVTNDLPLALFVFLSVVAFERVTERVTPPGVAALGMAVDAAMHAHDAPPASSLLRIGAALTRGRALPEAWVWGFLNCFKSFARRPSFLFGRYSETGWWYYFPATIALKTPLPLLALLAA